MWESISDFVSNLIENPLAILEIAAYVVAVASVVAKLTPNQTDDKYVAWLQNVLDKFALNPKRDKNA